MTPARYIEAARVPRHLPHWKDGNRNFQFVKARELSTVLGCTEFAVLSEVNMAGLHMVSEDGYGGHVIMDDTPHELRKHLPIFVHGRGNILKTGLGLGCVVRGLLTKPDVRHITVIEIDPRIIKHVGPEFAGNPRVTIVQGDALTMPIKPNTKWDYAWHDIYTEGNEGLQVLHAELLGRYRQFTRVQGAWAFPREFAKRWPWPLLGAPQTRDILTPDRRRGSLGG